MQQQPQHEKICATNTTKPQPTTTTAISNKNSTSVLPLSLPNAIAQDEQLHNWPALHEAAATGNEAVLGNLLNGGILRTAKEPKQGNTALHEAAWRGYSRCVKLLCAPPTQIASDNSSSHKKFSCVLRKRKKHTQDTQRAVANIHILLMSMQNHAGFTALHLAAQQGHNQSCRELLLAGAEPNVQNKYGDTALHTACRYGHAGATRILLSGSCDPNRINLNGDTPLHISCAMRRRKLTRILLTEGDCDISIKNSQNETPLDIAIRKSYVEIFDILNNQQRLRQQCKQRHKADNSNKKTKDKALPASDPFNWSPYGCHYFPDPRDFPAPKLDTMPKEPLAQGEQYYSDLNGCIRKGPIGVGSTCYCAPFFRHIEHKINCNRRSLRRYVHNAKATLGNEVKALAERTTQQIEQLTRDMLCDRVRCESRRRHIDFWLQMAAATQQQQETSDSKLESAQNVDGLIEEVPQEILTRQYSLSRCQSLDALSEHKSIFSQLSNLRANNAQSCGLLDDLPTKSRRRFVVSPTDSLEKQLSDDAQTETGSSINIKQTSAANQEDKIDSAEHMQQGEAEQAEKIYNKNTTLKQQENIAEQQQPKRLQTEIADEPVAAVTSVLVQKQLFEEQIKLRSNQQRLLPKIKVAQDKKLIVRAEISHNGQLEQYDEDENRSTPTTTTFVVPKEKLDTPSYAQLKKTLPARFENMNNCVSELANTLEEVHLTPTPILSAMCAASLDALSDTNTEDSDENDEDIVNEHVDGRHSAMDYLYELRKSLQTTVPTTTTTNEVPNKRLLDTEHILMNNNNNGLFSNHNFNSNLQERLVPKNAYFHPLPNKLQYHNNNNNNNNNEQINNHNNQNIYNNNNNQPQNILNYENTGTFLMRRRAFVHNNSNNQYMSPVNSNSGSSIASSTDYKRALRHAVVSRQPLPAYLKPLPNPPLTEKPYDANLSNDSGSSGHTYVERVAISPNQHLHNNNNNYMRNTLQPASSQLIYSANTVALALANDSTETAENDANGVYPLVSSLV